jgi:hypothetical protein
MSAPASASPSVTPHGNAAQSLAVERPPGWTAWAGIAYVALSLTGLALAPLPDLGADAREMQRFLTSVSPLPYAAGGVTELLAYLCLLMFAVGLISPARALGHRGAAVMLAPLGAAMAAVTLITGAALVGAVVLTRTLPLPTAQAMLAAGSLATWLSVAGIALTLAALAALGPLGTSLPRWSARAAAVVAVLLAAAIPFAETPWAHTPALLLDIWVLIAAVILLRRSATAP